MRSGGFRFHLELFALIILASFLATLPLMWVVSESSPIVYCLVMLVLFVLLLISSRLEQKRSWRDEAVGHDKAIGWQGLLAAQSAIALFWLVLFRLMER